MRERSERYTTRTRTVFSRSENDWVRERYQAYTPNELEQAIDAGLVEGDAESGYVVAGVRGAELRDEGFNEAYTSAYDSANDRAWTQTLVDQLLTTADVVLTLASLGAGGVALRGLRAASGLIGRALARSGVPRALAVARRLEAFAGGGRLAGGILRSGALPRTGRLDIRPATVVREIQHGERAASIVDEVTALTESTGVEHAVVSLQTGERLILSGGVDGIDLRSLPVRHLFGHSHPFWLPATGPSAADARTLRHYGQRTSRLLEYSWQDGRPILYTFQAAP